MDEKLKVLIVDDTLFMRKAVAQILDSDPGIEVLDAAKNGLEALQKVKQLKPDVITLDIDMPVMDGITAIKHIMVKSPVPIVVLSSLTNDGIVTFEALRLGVVDFVPKPSGAVSVDIERSKQQIVDRIKAAHTVNLENVRRVRLEKNWDKDKRLADLYGYYPLEYLVAVGTTLSGPNTVIRMLSKLSPTIPAAVVVIQEISPRIIDSFVSEFDKHVPWKIAVARDGLPLEQGTCYICSNEYSLSLDVNEKGESCLKVGERVTDPLNRFFSSVAETYHENAVGILLTGIGDDGSEGFAKIKKNAGVTIVQDAKCCVYPNLTNNAIRNGVVDMVIDEVNLVAAIESIMR
jgi:two-component system chemotaxis response regulator CheB